MRFFSTLIASTLGALLAIGIVVFFGMFLIFAFAAGSNQAPRVRPGSVLVVPLSGTVPEIASDDPITQSFAGGSRFDLIHFVDALEKASQDEDIDGIWLQLRGLSAGWSTLEEMRSALTSFKESGKFIVASSDDQAISEGVYFLASTADKIYASAQAPFEFNGFYIAAEFYKNLLDKLDIQAQPIRAGAYKSAVEPFLRSTLSPENREQLDGLLEDQYQVFLNAISDSRGLPQDDLVSVMETELIFLATDAYRVGLVDDLLFHDEVETRVKERLELDKEDELRSISLSAYLKTPSSNTALSRNADNDIAIVYAVGTIMPGKSGYSPNPLFGGDILGSETFNDAIQVALDSDKVKAIVVRIDSPGGSSAASDAMWRQLSLAAEEKPVIISMGDVAASGGFWIATAGDMIVADPLTITGSIGVFSMMLDTSEMFEDKLGITFDVVRTGPFADMYSGTRALSPEEIRLLEKSTDETYKTFLELVAESRGMTIDEVDALAQGRVWTGQDAYDAGLIDKLGNLNTAIELAAERADLTAEEYGIRILPRPKTFFERMNETLYIRARETFMNLTHSPTELFILQELRKMERLIELNGSVQALMPFKIAIR